MKKLGLFILLVMAMPVAVFGAPSIPSNFEITDITTSSLTVDFDDNTDEDTDLYYIHYGKSSSKFQGRWRIDKADYASEVPYTIQGLDSDTTYYIKVSAVGGSIESDTSTLSEKTGAIDLKVSITNTNTLTITVDNSNAAAGHFIYWGETSHSDNDIALYENQQDIGTESRYVITDLEEKTYYFRAAAYNAEKETIQTSEEVSLTNGVSGTLLSNTAPEDGCFISSVAHISYWPFLLWIPVIAGLAIRYARGRSHLLVLLIGVALCMAISTNASGEPVPVSVKVATESPNQLNKNVIAIKAGYYEPAEKIMEKVYDDNMLYSLYYERDLFRLFTISKKRYDIDVRISVDVSAGYMRSKGSGILVAGGGETDIEARLEMVPASASMSLNICLSPLVTFYGGAGPTYLYYKEDFQGETTEGHIGGWHGKAGVKLYADDVDFQYRPGVLIEVDYAQIDRMGDNKEDLGGLTYTFGFIYRF